MPKGFMPQFMIYELFMLRTKEIATVLEKPVVYSDIDSVCIPVDYVH